MENMQSIMIIVKFSRVLLHNLLGEFECIRTLRRWHVVLIFLQILRVVFRWSICEQIRDVAFARSALVDRERSGELAVGAKLYRV